MSDYDTISRLDIIIQQNNQIIVCLQNLAEPKEEREQANEKDDFAKKKFVKKTFEEAPEVEEVSEDEMGAL